MAKQRVSKPKKQLDRFLVVCEGKCEVWYFGYVLNTEKYTTISPGYSKSNAKKLIAYVEKISSKRVYKKIYCVFDRDSKSNTVEQLQSANKIIKDSKGKLERVLSNPCIEVAFWFNFFKYKKIFNDSDDVIASLNKKLSKEYEKTENVIKHVHELTNFGQICKNAKHVYYDQLKINDSNWLSTEDGYSEIFKLGN